MLKSNQSFRFLGESSTLSLLPATQSITVEIHSSRNLNISAISDLQMGSNNQLY